MTDCASRKPREAFEMSFNGTDEPEICVPEAVVYGSVAAHLAYSQVVLLCLDVLHDERLNKDSYKNSTIETSKSVGEVARAGIASHA